MRIPDEDEALNELKGSSPIIGVSVVGVEVIWIARR